MRPWYRYTYTDLVSEKKHHLNQVGTLKKLKDILTKNRTGNYRFSVKKIKTHTGIGFEIKRKRTLPRYILDIVLGSINFEKSWHNWERHGKPSVRIYFTEELIRNPGDPVGRCSCVIEYFFGKENVKKDDLMHRSYEISPLGYDNFAEIVIREPLPIGNLVHDAMKNVYDDIIKEFTFLSIKKEGDYGFPD